MWLPLSRTCFLSRMHSRLRARQPLDPPDPEDDEPPEDELSELADVSAARYITDRTSISIFLRIDLTSRARSTSSCPVVENRK